MSAWTRAEVEAIVDDYLAMLASELAGTPYSKAAHARALRPRLSNRSRQAIEYKHANISAALIELGFPYIDGYKPRFHYQTLLADVLVERLQRSRDLLHIAAADADRPIVVPEVPDVLAVVTEPPTMPAGVRMVADANPARSGLLTNYLEREARNQSLGAAGELFILGYERERLSRLGHERLAARIEHTSRVRGDYEGYDILSFEESGAERLIEVKTTKYGSQTPFFVTPHEVATSEKQAPRYHVYRLYAFRNAPRLYMLRGAIESSCHLLPSCYRAIPK